MMGADSVKVIFKYFQIQYADGYDTRLPFILDSELAKAPEKRKRLILNGIERILLDDSYNLDDYRAWLFSNKRMRGLPKKLKGDGSQESLDLDEDEGLGEIMALACDASGELAVIQSNQHAMNYKTLAKAINKIAPHAHIKFLPILRIDAIERLEKSRLLKKLHIKIAGYKTFEHLREYGLGVKDALAFQALQQAPVLDVIWSMGKERDEGLPSMLKNLLKALINYKNEEPEDHTLQALDAVLQMEVDGAKISDPVDFLTDRIFSIAHISLNEKRELDENSLLCAACDALIEKRNELDKYLVSSQAD